MKNFIYVRATLKFRKLTIWERITGKLNNENIIKSCLFSYLFYPAFSDTDCTNRGRESVKSPKDSFWVDASIELQKQENNINNKTF